MNWQRWFRLGQRYSPAADVPSSQPPKRTTCGLAGPAGLIGPALASGKYYNQLPNTILQQQFRNSYTAFLRAIGTPGSLIPNMYQPSPFFADKAKPWISPEELKARIESLKKIEPHMVATRVPDMTAFIVGCRAWAVSGFGLCGLGTVVRWQAKPLDTHIPAKCEVVGGYPHADPAPSIDCSCGWWAYKDFDILQSKLADYLTQEICLGPVNLWGEVIETEIGYRAQYAYPKELWLLSPDQERLGTIYGVPVRSL